MPTRTRTFAERSAAARKGWETRRRRQAVRDAIRKAEADAKTARAVRRKLRKLERDRDAAGIAPRADERRRKVFPHQLAYDDVLPEGCELELSIRYDPE